MFWHGVCWRKLRPSSPNFLGKKHVSGSGLVAYAPLHPISCLSSIFEKRWRIVNRRAPCQPSISALCHHHTTPDLSQTSPTCRQIPRDAERQPSPSSPGLTDMHPATPMPASHLMPRCTACQCSAKRDLPAHQVLGDGAHTASYNINLETCTMQCVEPEINRMSPTQLPRPLGKLPQAFHGLTDACPACPS